MTKRQLPTHHPARSARAIAVLLLLVLTTWPALAKERLAGVMSQGGLLSAQSLLPSALEARLRPYLEARANRRSVARSEAIAHPSQAELFALARSWSSLSPSFRELYQAATQLPPGRSIFTTPGGHYDVLYVTTGADAVDQTDTFGYDPRNWRTPIHGPNGVPDYIDGVGWACDSAWSMEVERFGFVAGAGEVSTEYPSGRYKIVVMDLDAYGSDSYYGLTPPGAPIGGGTGFTSHMEIRSSWRGSLWQNVAGNNYEAHPELAVRITCVHEYFHAVQYAMTHLVDGSIYLDQFPVSWIEATAVMMEDLGFDSVNDFIQYCGDYFDHPTNRLFSPTDLDTRTVYKNCVVTLFLYAFCPGGPGIGLVKNVFTNNYAAATDFGANLEQSARQLGGRWEDLLGSFHSRSYYTGSRSRPGMFIDEAARLPQWAPDTTGRGASHSSRKVDVAPYGMGMCGHIRQALDRDTLDIACEARHTSDAQAYDDHWAVNVLLRSRGAAQFDSIVALSVDNNGRSSVSIHPWSVFDEALVLISNADANRDGEAWLAFDTSATVPPPALRELTVFPNPISLRAQKRTVSIGGPGLTHAAVYTVDGTLLWQAAPSTSDPAVVWPVTGAGSRMVGPGTYFVVLRYREPYSARDEYTRRKLLVVP